jgi:hypothetical protein
MATCTRGGLFCLLPTPNLTHQVLRPEGLELTQVCTGLRAWSHAIYLRESSHAIESRCQVTLSLVDAINSPAIPTHAATWSRSKRLVGRR